ncbi:phage tail protein, partial [Klebsiella pneumoniae]|nr:phage tail protein [Klebsiella pneumoniae]
MVKTIEEFDSVSIVNASIQFKKNGTQEPGTKFGCVG